MCGIFACIGIKEIHKVLLNGLKRLEYRGYDSAGISFIDNNKKQLRVYKEAGKVSKLGARISELNNKETQVGISHTRWATHGKPNKKNAHPHVNKKKTIAIVHNGIIENYIELKEELLNFGYKIISETDSELLVHLIDYFYKGDLKKALKKALSKVVGTYGIAAISREEPNKIFGARKGSPLIVGVKNGSAFLSSDTASIAPHTKEVIYLDDGEIISLEKESYNISSLSKKSIEKKTTYIDFDTTSIQKRGYEHFMLKEIFEQVESVRNTFLGRISLDKGTVTLGGLNMSITEINKIKRVVILACGTSWHAAMLGEYFIENWANIPVEVDYASEFTHRNCILEKDTFVIVISQSGETADTLSALREVKNRGLKVYGMVNTVGSSIARESDGGIYIHAGPEIGVASTKAFTSQVVALLLLSIYFGRARFLSKSKGIEILEEINDIPNKIKETLQLKDEIKKVSEKYLIKNHALYLGRSYNFPIALEGALKLKEISYIHAEGYPAAEMKHGPIALIDKNMPVIIIATQSQLYDKTLSNIQEIKAREGKIIAIASKGDLKIKNYCDHVLYVPQTMETLSTLLNIIPLQLIAYYTALERGCNVDQPRNLAKSVTVE